MFSFISLHEIRISFPSYFSSDFQMSDIFGGAERLCHLENMRKFPGYHLDCCP